MVDLSCERRLTSSDCLTLSEILILESYSPVAALSGPLIVREHRGVVVSLSALLKTLSRSLVSAEELRTIICEVAAVINDRPLSYVYDDADIPHPISPAMFLRGGPPNSPLCSLTPLDKFGPDGLPPAPVSEEERLRRALRERTNYFRALSVRWYREYLLLLRSANIYKSGKSQTNAKGDVCILKEDNLPRVRWNLVRIEDSHPGRDGAVRTYTIRFANGNVSRRPAQLLIPLEVYHNQTHQ